MCSVRVLAWWVRGACLGVGRSALSDRVVTLASELRRRARDRRTRGAPKRHTRGRTASRCTSSTKRAAARSRITRDEQDAVTAAREWWIGQLDDGRAPREVAVITRTNQLRAALNQELRQQAAERGLHSGPEYRVAHERGASDLLVRVGDRLVLRENSHDPRLLNGMLGTIEKISSHGHGVALRLRRRLDTRRRARLVPPSRLRRPRLRDHRTRQPRHHARRGTGRRPARGSLTRMVVHRRQSRTRPHPAPRHRHGDSARRPRTRRRGHSAGKPESRYTRARTRCHASP